MVQKNNVCFISDFDETLFKNKVKRNKWPSEVASSAYDDFIVLHVYLAFKTNLRLIKRGNASQSYNKWYTPGDQC